MKFIILVFYYERYWHISRTIDSVLWQDYKDWEIFLIDDGSKFPIRDFIDLSCLSKNKITIVEIGDSEKDKKHRELLHKTKGGSIFGAFANTALETTDADYAIMLCDDDLLLPGYLSSLDRWYRHNDEKYSYCHLQFKNPETTEIIENEYTRYLNGKTHRINPVNELDSSQVSWSVDAWKKSNIKFPYPQTANLDAHIYHQMFELWGECPFNQIIGQVKGIHKDQLINK